MRILSYQHPSWLTNTYLLQANNSKAAILIDAGAPLSTWTTELNEISEGIQAIFLTHMHQDHIDCLKEWVDRYKCPVYAHPKSRSDSGIKLSPMADQSTISMAGFQIKAISTPGHVPDHLAFLVNDDMLFTGDLIFKGSVGGTRQGSFADLKESVMKKVFTLAPETQILPGHSGASSIKDEWESNPFVRAWRGVDGVQSKACTYQGKPAEMQVLGRDYDGEGKAWIKIEGKDHIVAWE